MTDPDMGAWIYKYDALGNLTSQQDAKGQFTCLYYDELNRLIIKNYQTSGDCPSTPITPHAVEYTYDSGVNGIGRRTSMTDSSGSTGWIYDARGRLIFQDKNIAGSSYMMYWEYNSADLVSSFMYPGGEVVTTNYLPQTSVDTVAGMDEYVLTSQYDEAGRLIHREYAFGENEVSDYDYRAWDYKDQYNTPMGGRLHHVVSQDDYHTYQDNSYTYDANGNIASISDLVAGAPQTQVFTYDAIDRLFSTAVSGGYNGNYIETNTYNTAGKLVTNGEGTRTYSTTQPHAATALGAEGFSYDENGNQKTRDYNSVNYTLTYDAENRLVMIFETGTDPQVTTGEYTYDGDGKRVLAKVNNVTTRYLDNYYEASSFGVTTEVTKYYYAGSQRVAWRVGEVGLYFGFGDHLGSTSVAVDADTGNITGSELYKAWGENVTYGSLNTDYKYTGQRQAEAGLYFYDAAGDAPKGRTIYSSRFHNS